MAKVPEGAEVAVLIVANTASPVLYAPEAESLRDNHPSSRNACPVSASNHRPRPGRAPSPIVARNGFCAVVLWCVGQRRAAQRRYERRNASVVAGRHWVGGAGLYR